MPVPNAHARLRRLKEERDAARAAAGTGAAPVRPAEGAAPSIFGVTVAGATAAADATTSAAGVAPSAPRPLRLPAIVDAADPLPRGAPTTVVRDAGGRLHVESQNRTTAGGRSRRDVDDVLALPGIGEQLVAAMFKRALVRTDLAWIGYAAAGRTLVDPIRGLGLQDTAPSKLPADLFDRIEDWLRARDDTMTLPTSLRDLLNTGRWLVGAIPECAHVDVRRDNYEAHGKPHWTMVDGLPEPVASSRWGDADTERFLKLCSREVLAAVASWNQLAGCVATGDVGDGPVCRDALVIARAMLAANPSLPTAWRKLASDPEVEGAMVALGKREVERWRLEEDAGADLGPARRRTVSCWRRVVSGERRLPRPGGKWKEARGILKAGWDIAVRVAYPTRRGLAPFAALLAIASRLNVDPLMTLSDEEFGIDDADGTGGAGADGAEVRDRLRGAPFKRRAHRPYPVDFPVTVEVDDPAPMHAFVRTWTEGLRDVAGDDAGSLFLFVGRLWHSGAVCSYAHSAGRGSFDEELGDLCARAGVPRITPRELRRIGIDLIHDACDGDPVAMLAAGYWRDLRTGERHYFGPAIVMRGQESIGWGLKIELRRLEHGIETLGRPKGSDLFAATDGFSCANPLDGPDPQEPGEICRARGLCAICPHADVDLADPAWSFAKMAGLAAYVSDRLAQGAGPAWTARYEPVLDELRELWLPLFPDAVVDAARHLPRMEQEELTA